MPEETFSPNADDQCAADQPPTVTRREFLADLFVGVAFLSTAIGILNAVARYIVPPKQSIQGTSENIEIANLSELQEGTSKYFAYNNVPCALINVGGEIKGFSRVCTHLQCAIDWDKKSQTFLCPCHAAVFDTNGRVVSGPAPKPIPELKVNVKDGKIYVGGWA